MFYKKNVFRFSDFRGGLKRVEINKMIGNETKNVFYLVDFEYMRILICVHLSVRVVFLSSDKNDVYLLFYLLKQHHK